MADRDLETLERWMFGVITDPGGVEAGIEGAAARSAIDIGLDDLETVVDRSRSLSAADRLRIYANAYIWRLIDVLAEEFPTVRHALGPERFGQLARAYVQAHPSRHYSLERLGASLADYLSAEAADFPERACLADVARLERTIEEVFHDRPAESLTVDDLLAIPRADWPAARFEMIPAFRLLALDHPAHAYVAAVREERPMELPGRRPSWVVVHRREFTVWRSPLSQVQHALLSILAAGGPLAAALEGACDVPGVDVGALVADLETWFRDWTAEGLFHRVTVDP